MRSRNRETPNAFLVRAGDHVLVEASQENQMTLKFISLTAAAALFAASGALAQGYNSTSLSSTASKSTTTSTTSKSTTTSKAASTDKLSTKEINSAVTLDKVQDAAMLETAKVEDARGNSLGTVKSVEKDASGTPQAVHIDFGPWLGSGEHVVSIAAKDARYVSEKNVVLIRMSKAEVQKLPEIKS